MSIDLLSGKQQYKTRSKFLWVDVSVLNEIISGGNAKTKHAREVKEKYRNEKFSKPFCNQETGETTNTIESQTAQNQENQNKLFKTDVKKIIQGNWQKLVKEPLKTE